MGVSADTDACIGVWEPRWGVTAAAAAAAYLMGGRTTGAGRGGC